MSLFLKVILFPLYLPLKFIGKLVEFMLTQESEEEQERKALRMQILVLLSSVEKIGVLKMREQLTRIDKKNSFIPLHVLVQYLNELIRQKLVEVVTINIPIGTVVLEKRNTL